MHNVVIVFIVFISGCNTFPQPLLYPWGQQSAYSLSTRTRTSAFYSRYFRTGEIFEVAFYIVVKRYISCYHRLPALAGHSCLTACQISTHVSNDHPRSDSVAKVVWFQYSVRLWVCMFVNMILLSRLRCHHQSFMGARWSKARLSSKMAAF